MHYTVTGLGFGDEGKGTVVDWLCATRPIQAVIRHNGGSQAGHNVVMPDGRSHTFSQFGSGAFHGVPTHLSKYMLVNPLSMIPEAEHLRIITGVSPFATTTISPDALLITPLHRVANRLKENARGVNAHGSCGQGIGETTNYSLEQPELAPRLGDLRQPDVLKEKLVALQTWYHETGLMLGTSVIDDMLIRDMLAKYESLLPMLWFMSDDDIMEGLEKKECVFEGAQGVLLDQDYGFHPHTTWSRTTDANALEILGGADVLRIGVTRTYGTRHGAGPFPGQNPAVTWDEPHNTSEGFQGAWRRGHLNLSLLEYAVKAHGGVDTIALTHCDRPPTHYVDFAGKLKLPHNQADQERLTHMIESAPAQLHSTDSRNLEDVITDRTSIPIGLKSSGPTSKDKTLTDNSRMMAR